jgi:DNA-directed RNA polymerase subunit beta'
MYQCGVPKEMAIELFRPFVMKKLVEDSVANNIKSAKKMVDRQKPEVWDALDVVIKEHPVLLNRAPTLHRLGIQAFEPVLVEGRALKLHPLACTAYNADFDGDQMAIHVPLSAEAQAEARILMLSVNNLLRPQDGHPHSIPTQDMVLGSYYLTYVREEEGTGMAFSTPEEALMAYQAGAVTLHSPIKVRVTKTIDGVEKYKTVETTVGRIIFNEPIPQDLGFVDRTDPEHAFDYEVGFRVDKKKLGEIIDRCIQKHGFTISAEVLDSIKAQGYKFSTRSGMTISIADMVVPEAKKEKIAETEKKVLAIEKQYRRGLITNDERYRMVVAEWERTTGEVAKALMDNLDEFNPINIMATSGARGSANQIRQLAGMRGLMANTAGKTIEIPIKANFREGLSVLEYFISTRGARKGMADTALRTADSGYLTRRMVDVSQDVIIREPDCGTTEGVPATAIDSRGYAVFTLDPEDPKYDEYIHSFGENIHGRFPAKPVVDPKTGEVLFDTDHLLMSGDAKFLAAHGVASVEVRSVLSCESRCGVCARCYGMNLATGKPVNSGEAVGVIAAQSIGEPGTQLTMRTFHSGGVAGDDITQGLPRVEELFEARKPKKMAVLSEISGTLTIEEARKNMMALTVTNAEQGETRVYQVPVGAGIIVQNGDHIEQGQELTRGALSPHDVLRIRGVNDDEFGRPGVRNYLVQEVQKVYRQQGVDINNKHIEVIVRQMMRKVRIEDAGSTDLLSGSTVDVNELKDANKAIQARIDAGEEGLTLAAGTPILLGITKASLATDSWMSAASFQETTKVLTEAAIKGKVDHLVGLKENVIIGKLIPAGSGLDMYRNFEMKTDESIEDEADYVDLSELKKLTNAL